MKKIIPLFLTLVLLLSVSGNAAATEATDPTVSYDQSVTASYSATEAEAAVISVDISWEGTDFTYVGATDPVWDPSKHQYVEQEGGWKEGAATISVTNHSDVMLQAQLDYSQKDGFTDIDMYFTDAAPYVGSAYTSETEAGTACKVQVLAVPAGQLPSDTTDATIGTIYLTLTPVTDHTVVHSAIASGYSNIPVYDGQTADRGTAYFASETDKSNIGLLCDDVSAVLYVEGVSDADKNVALNSLITAFYNGLKIGQ